MNIVFRCINPTLAPFPLGGVGGGGGGGGESAHFCGTLYLFEIASVWSCNTGYGQVGIGALFYSNAVFMMRFSH